MTYYERERKNKKNENQIVYLLANLCNIFDDAFLLTSVYMTLKYELSVRFCFYAY